LRVSASPARPSCFTQAVLILHQILPTLADTLDDLRVLGDLGYEGEADTITVAFKKPQRGRSPTPRNRYRRAG
jgi:hypothetical protein